MTRPASIGSPIRRSIVASGAAAASLAWSATAARRHTVSGREARLFRALNEGVAFVEVPARIVMQAGSLAAVWVSAAVVDLRWSRRSRAQTIAATGTAVWAGVKVVKRAIGRGRPDRHLDDVVTRGSAPSGLGYPSGHAAVATFLALLLTPPGSGRAIALTVAAATGAARIHVGAHLPLDVVGGHAIGVLAATAVDTACRCR